MKNRLNSFSKRLALAAMLLSTMAPAVPAQDREHRGVVARGQSLRALPGADACLSENLDTRSLSEKHFALAGELVPGDLI